MSLPRRPPSPVFGGEMMRVPEPEPEVGGGAVYEAGGGGGADGEEDGGDAAAQVMLIAVLLLMPPALAETLAVPAWLLAVKTPKTLPPAVVPWVGVILPLVALRVTVVPSATAVPADVFTAREMAVLPPQLSALEDELNVIWAGGPAADVTEPPAWAQSDWL
jgi:hypothetical protein